MPECPVIFLVGPTAVGKTELSIGLAKQIDAEIVSVDSRLLYRGMDIGTAKPNKAQLGSVKHHLIDVADPSERWSLSRYLELATLAIRGIHAQRKVPLLVGGTGQYIHALIEGWQPPPEADDPDFRRRLHQIAENEGKSSLHTRLEKIDPVSAARIDKRNLRRVIRALEIHHVTGLLPSEQRKKSPPDYSFLLLGLRRERKELYKRIDDRIDLMVASGWVDEVAELMGQGYELDSSALSAIGYRQIADYLNGKHDLQTAIDLIKRLTRQFVRRQDNWFRRLASDIHWFEPGENTLSEMAALVLSWLAA